jgi:DNA-binding transcriptional ArsR family regulator
MPQVSVTGSRQSGATAAAPALDVARLRVAIARLSRRLRRHELAGLTPTQLSALATVDRAGPLRLGDLAAAEGIAPSTLTRLVTALEERGYVERCPVPGDARASTPTPTPATPAPADHRSLAGDQEAPSAKGSRGRPHEHCGRVH